MRHVVMFSGGVMSWAAARRVAEQHGTASLTLLFADTSMEDADLYRFVAEAAANVGGELVTLRDGRTPWQVVHDERYLNHHAAPCSRVLKRELADRWVKDNCDPADTVRYVGFDWTELHRLAAMRAALPGWRVEAPMTEPPYLNRTDLFNLLAAAGIELPRLYRLGFRHNNCGGFCVKAGQGHFAHLLRTLPERYAEHEAEEEAFRQFIGKDVSILRDRVGGDTKPLTLRELRERIQSAPQTIDLFDWGGCGCFTESDP